MKASLKEKLCIDYSNSILEKLMLIEISKLKKNKTPIFLTPISFFGGFWETFKNREKTSSWIEIISIILFIVRSFVLIIVYAIYSPIHFAVRIIVILTGDIYFKRKIFALKSGSQHDYETSTLKTFSQLWKSKGLEYPRYWASPKLKKECIYFWFAVLYDKSEDESAILLKLIEDKIWKERSDFNRENSGIHSDWCDMSESISVEIDEKYETYDDVENNFVIIDKLSAKRILEKSILDLLEQTENITKADIEVEVINNACLACLKNQKNKERQGKNIEEKYRNIFKATKDFVPIAKAFIEGAMELFPQHFTEKEASWCMWEIQQRVRLEDIWDSLTDYFQRNHGIQINHEHIENENSFFPEADEIQSPVEEVELFEKIKKSGFSFTPSSYRIWMKGKCIKIGNTHSKITAVVLKSKTPEETTFQIRVSEETLRNEITLITDFDIFFKSNERYMMATIPLNETENDCIGINMLRLVHGPTRNQKFFNSNEPFGCSIFTSDEKLSKVSFAFNDPEKLIEFTKSE